MSDKIISASEITVTSLTPLEKVGETRKLEDATYGPRYFKYVKFNNGSGNVASAAGQAVTYLVSDVKRTTVTNDISDSVANLAAGVLVAAPADLEYTWLLVEGYYPTIKADGDDDIAAGDLLVMNTSVDGSTDSVAAGTAPTHRVLGIASAADVDADNTVAGFVTIGR